MVVDQLCLSDASRATYRTDFWTDGTITGVFVPLQRVALSNELEKNPFR